MCSFGIEPCQSNAADHGWWAVGGGWWVVDGGWGWDLAWRNLVWVIVKDLSPKFSEAIVNMIVKFKFKFKFYRLVVNMM